MKTTQLDFKFTRDWCTYHFPKWKRFKPNSVLEIGSFEGRSALFWIEQGAKDVVCIDNWAGGEEHINIDFSIVEDNFDYNTRNYVQITKIKGRSVECLSSLISAQKKFDLVYIDGSHKAHDVLTDAVLSFELLNSNGIMIFDDYLWYDSYRFEDWGEKKPLHIESYPKPAIDSFINIFANYLKIERLGRQAIVMKL